MVSAENADFGGDELNEILEEFFTEADENLDTLEQDLIKLEALAGEDSGATDKETVDRIFRMLHTLKGGAGFLGLEKIAKLAHAGENLLDEVRQDKVHITKPVMDALLQTTDMLKELLQIQKNRESDDGVDTNPLRAILADLAAGKAVEVPATKPFNLLDEVMSDPILDPSRDTGEDGPAPVKAAEPLPAPQPVVVAQPEVEAEDDEPDDADDEDEDDHTPAQPESAEEQKPFNLLDEVMNDPILDPSRDSGEEGPAPKPVTPVAAPVAAAQPVPAAVTAPVAMVKTEPQAEQRKPDERRQQMRRSDDAGSETIRVETSRLDKVMNLVGELVLARNTLVRQVNAQETRASLEKLANSGIIYSTVEQLSRVTQDLQMSVLSTRMQPIKKVFDKIPRQVRELKTQLGKEVNLIIEGEETEVDKSLVEELADPMVHMIRNALDHGIEMPDVRKAGGKHPEGTLVVRAFYEGNNVVIQVQEDGAGMDPNKLRKVGVSKGLISESAAMAMSDAEAIRLIMAPGFSTAEKITDVSGRGVGMDVVNTKIANLQGSVDIRSELGVGTCFSIYMPLTLAIVNALIVGANEEGFAIPIGDIAEVIKFQPDATHRVSDQDVIELRGESLPLFYLGKLTHTGLIPSVKQLQQAILSQEELHKLQSKSEITLDDLDRVAGAAVQDVEAPDGLKKAKVGNGFVVVVRESSSSMGLVVDALLGQEEVVVKQVSGMFEYNKAISGATITGDGKVHMILDVPYLLKELSGVR
jgi:two-component system chemotaxis sensor kinase CheA